MDFKIPVVIQGFFYVLISLFESVIKGSCCYKRLLKANRKLLKDVSIFFLCISKIVFKFVCLSSKSNKVSFRFFKIMSE